MAFPYRAFLSCISPCTSRFPNRKMAFSGSIESLLPANSTDWLSGTSLSVKKSESLESYLTKKKELFSSQVYVIELLS